MSLKSTLAKLVASFIASRLKREGHQAPRFQQYWMRELLRTAANTRFGKDHAFAGIHTYDAFKAHIPIRDYEQLRSYIDVATAGEADVLWPGRPSYWSKTSGTTSGVKYIPITRESIPFHIRAARNALLCYIAETGNAGFLDGKLIFLSGSPELDTRNGIPVGRLSGIVNHHVPAYLRRNQMPTYETNCIDDWEVKVEAIVKETIDQPMTLISGIPPWVQMYFDKLTAQSGKPVGELFPHFSLFVYGGVNFEPYRTKLEASIGRKVDTLETYPASEGFIAFQDTQTAPGLLLLTNNGIFYEFIPVDRFHEKDPPRLALWEVEMGVNYALILNTNAGLFGYSIGDTVRFVSLDPPRIVVTGRVKHFISAFGEHVIGEEVEQALLSVANRLQVGITEFTVAPQVNPPEGGLPYHEWLVEFESIPQNLSEFAAAVDLALQQKNIYYKDLLSGGILRTLVIRPIRKNGFIDFMKDQGKLGGQNKVPRLSNDRGIAGQLIPYTVD